MSWLDKITGKNKGGIAEAAGNVLETQIDRTRVGAAGAVKGGLKGIITEGANAIGVDGDQAVRTATNPGAALVGGLLGALGIGGRGNEVTTKAPPRPTGIDPTAPLREYAERQGNRAAGALRDTIKSDTLAPVVDKSTYSTEAIEEARRAGRDVSKLKLTPEDKVGTAAPSKELPADLKVMEAERLRREKLNENKVAETASPAAGATKVLPAESGGKIERLNAEPLKVEPLKPIADGITTKIDLVGNFAAVAPVVVAPTADVAPGVDISGGRFDKATYDKVNEFLKLNANAPKGPAP